MHINFEFKARHNDIDAVEEILLQHHPRFVGEDHQVDTYFNVPQGRMKMREGNIENSLIYYERTDDASAKQSDVTLYQNQPGSSLKQLLTQALGVKVVVDKTRRIYFIDNVKFHFDKVEGLGTFIEVEAIDKDGSIGVEKLKEQCNYYEDLLHIKKEDYESQSYSDLILVKKYSTIV